MLVQLLLLLLLRCCRRAVPVAAAGAAVMLADLKCFVLLVLWKESLPEYWEKTLASPWGPGHPIASNKERWHDTIPVCVHNDGSIAEK